MNIAICDDEPYWPREAESHIRAWAARRNVDVSCAAYSTTDELFARVASSDPLDLVLLDIAFADRESAGMSVAKRIRKMGVDVPLVFLTSNPMMAQDGYLVEAMGYLLKPIDERRLSLYLDRLHKRCRAQRSIRIDTHDGVARIVLDDLCYAEVRDHTLRLHTHKGQCETRLTLAELLEQIGDEYFVQIHRSFVVSKSKILSIRSSYPRSLEVAVGAEKHTLAIGRGYFERAMQAYAGDALERLL